MKLGDLKQTRLHFSMMCALFGFIGYTYAYTYIYSISHIYICIHIHISVRVCVCACSVIYVCVRAHVEDIETVNVLKIHCQ